MLTEYSDVWVEFIISTRTAQGDSTLERPITFRVSTRNVTSLHF